jgi:hypothetical protein
MALFSQSSRSGGALSGCTLLPSAITGVVNDGSVQSGLAPATWIAITVEGART